MRKVGSQHEEINGESLHLSRDVDVNTKRPSNSNCGSGWAVFEDSRSLNSTNFPALIWPTSFAGIGENPSQPQRAAAESAPRQREKQYL